MRQLADHGATSASSSKPGLTIGVAVGTRPLCARTWFELRMYRSAPGVSTIAPSVPTLTSGTLYWNGAR